MQNAKCKIFLSTSLPDTRRVAKVILHSIFALILEDSHRCFATGNDADLRSVLIITLSTSDAIKANANHPLRVQSSPVARWNDVFFIFTQSTFRSTIAVRGVL